MADLPSLDALDRRILGSLLEKQRTVPASYPLSLAGLRTACNQSSSRDPVTDYDEASLETRLRELKGRGLVRVVWAGKGARTLKYHQLLEETLALPADEGALLTALLLRGPQSAGELRSRTERLHAFADRDEVEAALRRMAARDEPLVTELPRRSGRQDVRWSDRLSPPAAEAPAEPEAVVDLDTVVADGPSARDARIVAAYDTVAAAYAEHVGGELDDKPFDRWLLGRVAELAGGDPVVDVGCGTGHVTAFLAAAGANAAGIDLSPGMIAQARARFPGSTFEVGDLTRLLRPPTAAGWGAITGWYALVHHGSGELPATVTALARTLRPGGWLALALHVGSQVRHLDDWWGNPVDLDFVLHDADAVRAAVATTGLVDLEWYERGPLAGVEVDTRRLYVLGRRPA